MKREKNNCHSIIIKESAREKFTLNFKRESKREKFSLNFKREWDTFLKENESWKKNFKQRYNWGKLRSEKQREWEIPIKAKI